MRRTLLGLSTAALLAGCVVAPTATDRPGEPAPATPSLGLFSRIAVPDGQQATLQLAAKGVQIFRCDRVDGAYAWRFRQPEAELYDASGQAVGRHGANFSFEHRDGSRLLGTVMAHDKAPAADALPWLLLSAKSFGSGQFGGVSYVQRVNTNGGMPPPACTSAQLDRLLRVDFSADFVFYRPRS